MICSVVYKLAWGIGRSVEMVRIDDSRLEMKRNSGRVQ